MDSNSSFLRSEHLRVLQVITHLDLGGAESVAISLAEELRDQVEPLVFAVMGTNDGPVTRDMKARLDAIGAAYYRGTALPFKRGGLLQAGVRLASAIRATRPDLVHLHTELPEACWAVAAQIAAQVRTTPVVRTIHNVRLWPQWRPIGRWVERSLGNRYAAAVSNDALGGLSAFRIAAGLKPWPAAGTQVILNGVKPAPVRERSSRDPICRVLFAGRLERQKGADLLAAIWAGARERAAKPAELTVMGAGSLDGAINAAFRDNPSVCMVPPAPGLAGVLGDFDVLLMPSRFEGLGLVAIEAVMAGLPVIGFRAPGLQEVFPKHYRGLASPEDVPGIARLLADAIDSPNRFVDVVTHQSIADRFSLDRMAADYATLYTRLTTRGAPTAGIGPT